MPCLAAHRAVALLTVLLLNTSCVTTQLPPISAVGPGFRPLPDEARLWQESRAEEQAILAEVRLYDDPDLDAYLASVVARLNPRGMAANPEVHYRVRVIDDPTLNAFSYPHGALYLHTGLLVQLENEDQLATVLGHEMTHVENRHMLRLRRSAHNKQVALVVAQVATEVVATGAAWDAYDAGRYGKGQTIELFGDLLAAVALPLATLAAVNGYGRSLEAEADGGSFTKLAAADYEAAQAPRLYEILLADAGNAGATETFFFGSHPRLAERVANAERWVAEHPAQSPDTGVPTDSADSGSTAAATAGPAPNPAADTFHRRLAPVVRDDARLQLDLGRLDQAQAGLDRALAALPDDAETRFLLARLKLAQAAAATAPEVERALRADARAALAAATRLDPQLPAPHRELGLLLDRDDDWAAACGELRRYLELAPDAADAGDVAGHLDELERVGRCAAAAASDASILPP